ncbi:MAG: ASPIC/UnbV domain-containing protein [Ignavibacteriota bacterium]
MTRSAIGLHFGMAANTRVERISVAWPSGIRQVVSIQEKP